MVHITSVLPWSDTECPSRQFSQVLLNNSRKIENSAPAFRKQTTWLRLQQRTSRRVQTHTCAREVLFTVKKMSRTENTNGRVLSRREGTQVRGAESHLAGAMVGLGL